MSDTVKVKVREGWIVCDGDTQRTGGETVETDTRTAEQWLTANWVELVKATRTKTATKRR